MAKISATIITLNEEKNIERCIKSLDGIADEVIVLDSFSTDNTEAICRKLGVRFLQNEFKGYGDQKQKAVDAARYDFIVSLDADECLSEELRAALIKYKPLLGKEYDGFTVNRRNNYRGKWIRYSGWYPDKKSRIFNKHKMCWSGGNPHERVVFKEKVNVKYLNCDILHYTFTSIEQHKKTMLYYAKIYAETKYEKGKNKYVAWLKALGAPLLFIKLYLIKRGFLDGRAGLIICYEEAVYKFRKYLMLQKKYFKNDE